MPQSNQFNQSNPVNPGDLGFAHRFVPAPKPAEAATLLLLHGTGGSEEDLLPLGARLLPGASLLSPRGKILEHGMPRFFRRLAEGVFDVEDLVFRNEELARLITAAAALQHFDPAHLIAVRYCNRANIAASMLLLYPGTLAGAVLLRPMVPLEPSTPPNLADVPVLIAAGRHDTLVPPAQSEALAALLRSYGAQVTMHWQEANHALANQELVVARDWLRAL